MGRNAIYREVWSSLSCFPAPFARVRRREKKKSSTDQIILNAVFLFEFRLEYYKSAAKNAFVLFPPTNAGTYSASFKQIKV